MNRQLQALQQQKYKNIAVLKQAKQNKVDSQISICKSALKITIQQIYRAQEMLTMFEIVSSLKDMSNMSKSFNLGIEILSKEIINQTGTMDFGNVQLECEKALQCASNQIDSIDEMLSMSSESFEDMADYSKNRITDDEIDKYIENEFLLDEQNAEQIDKEIEEIKRVAKDKF